MKSSRRLAFLLPDMSGGGAERVVLQLIREFIDKGYEIDLLLLAKRGTLLDLVPDRVRIIDLGGTRMRDAFRPLIRYFRASDAVGIQVSMWPLTAIAIAAHRVARSRMRMVISEHAALSKQYGATSILNQLLLKRSIRTFYPLADARIAVSGGAADDLTMLTGIGRETIEVVYNPIQPPPEAKSTDPAIEASWGDADGRILNVGSLKHQKNHALLIKAFARVAERRPRAKLMILGDGELRAELTDLAAAHGLSDRVIFPGFVLDSWPYYQAADVFALSSDYEGLPLVIIEALRVGLPVVSTDCPSGPRELLDGGAFGTLVPVGNAEALAAAMLDALRAPRDAERLKRWAEGISGGVSDRYLQLMTAGNG